MLKHAPLHSIAQLTRKDKGSRQGALQRRRAARLFVFALFAGLLVVTLPASAQVGTSGTNTGNIRGTVLDSNDDVFPGATVTLQGPVDGDRQTALTSDDGSFVFENVPPQIPYQITVKADGFSQWDSSVTLEPSQSKVLTGITLRMEVVQKPVTVAFSSKEVAAQQLKAEEQQRILGFIPNVLVTYERHPEPLTTKMKFHLAFKDLTHPIFLARVAFIASLQQMRNSPDFGQGAEGYGKRVGVSAADAFSESVIGNALLPSLLHQDPRYFYHGDGTKKSRLIHAISSPFVCPGDNGKMQPNVSMWGGALASAAISNAYYPQTDRTAGRVFRTFGMDMGLHVGMSVLQEFVLAKVTSKRKKSSQ